MDMDKIPPQNLEAEQSFLGSLLIDRQAFYTAVEETGIRAGDFYRDAHARIYEALANLHSRNEPIDIITVQEELRGGGQLDGVGGTEYLMLLIDSVPTSAHASYYAGIIKDRAIRRQWIDQAQSLQSAAYDEGTELQAISLQAHEGDLRISERTVKGEWLPFSHLIPRVFSTVEAAYQTGTNIHGIPSGLPALDQITCGWNKGDLIIIAARPSMGKTALALQFAEHAAVCGVPTAIFSLEMQDQQLGLRALTAQSGLSGYALRNPNFDEERWAVLIAGARKLAELPVYINDQPSLDYTDIQVQSRRAVVQHGIGLFLLDFTQLAHGPKGESRNREMGIVADAMKATAKSLNVPFIALSQLSRRCEVEKREPELHDLRDCLPGDALVYNADTGDRVPIKTIAEGDLRFNVLGLSNWKFKPSTIMDVWSVGAKPILRIETESGRILRCSAGHRLLTPTGWARADHMVVGQDLANPRALPSGSQGGMDPEDAELLGWIIGDGSCQSGCADLTVCTEDECVYVSDLVERRFGFRPLVKPTDKKAYRVMMCKRGGVNGGNALTLWLKAQGIWRVSARSKHVPAGVFQASVPAIRAYLRGLFHADGSLPSTDRFKRSIKLVTISERLAHDTQHLLLKCRLLSSVHPYSASSSGYRTTTEKFWTVAISGRERVAQFVSDIGFLCEKQRRAQRFIQSWGDAQCDASHYDRLPQQLTDGLLLRIKQGNNLGWSDLGYYPQGKRMSRSRAASVGVQWNELGLLALSTSDLVWERIASIKLEGDQECFDLRVADTHCYCVDDFLTHNSGEIENYADVVILIHHLKDEGKAVLKVAKNRQLATGRVEVHWHKRTMRFAPRSDREDDE